MDITTWLHDLMRLHGITTQAGLAARIGVTRGLVGAWFNRRAIPGPEARDALIEAFSLNEAAAAVLRALCDKADRARREQRARNTAAA